MSDIDDREIPRPCSLSVGDMRKAVTKARKRNKVTGPARRADEFIVVVWYQPGQVWYQPGQLWYQGVA